MDEFADKRCYDGIGASTMKSSCNCEQQARPTSTTFLRGRVHPQFASHPFPVLERYHGRFPKGTGGDPRELGLRTWPLLALFTAALLNPGSRTPCSCITGDHTYQYNVHPPWYCNPAGRFAVPILFRAGRLFSGRDDRIAQHLDLLPSILDLSGYQEP